LESNPSRRRLLRIHVLPSPTSFEEASAFIVNSLLLSHGIREDSAAVVRVGGEWVYASGDSVRHLRPDADSSEGWLRAVLRGRRLGARRLERLDIPPLAVSVCLRCGPGEGLNLDPLKILLEATGAIYILYISGDEDVNLCRGRGWGAIPLRPHIAVAVVNIVLDRIEAGLDPL